LFFITGKVVREESEERQVIEAIIDFQTADLSGANLFGTNLSYAEGWTSEPLAQAESLVGAILPDGMKMTEEAWEEFKKRYRQ